MNKRLGQPGQDGAGQDGDPPLLGLEARQKNTVSSTHVALGMSLLQGPKLPLSETAAVKTMFAIPAARRRNGNTCRHPQKRVRSFGGKSTRDACRFQASPKRGSFLFSMSQQALEKNWAARSASNFLKTSTGCTRTMRTDKHWPHASFRRFIRKAM